MAGKDDDPASLPPGYDGSTGLPDSGWEGLTVATKGAYTKLHAAAMVAGVNFRMTEGFRPRRRQAFHYAKGRVLKFQDHNGNATAEPRDKYGLAHKEQGTVTKALPGKSKHESGTAFDIAIKGADPYNIESLSKVGALAESCGLQWGVDWNNDGKRDDLPHFQLLT